MNWAADKLPEILVPFTNKPTSATVILPGPGLPVNEPTKATVTCTTHTGSKLEILPSDRLLSLKTAQGELIEYRITEMRPLILESYPPVYQTTYKLDDGRSVRTEFRGEESDGRGYFIRLNGEASPSFTCQKN